MKVIEERSKIYGDFKDIANLSQNIKSLMFTAYEANEPVVCEGLDMIIHKLSRIGSTIDGYKNLDNWKDLSAYAKLVHDYLENQQGMIKTIVAYERTN